MSRDPNDFRNDTLTVQPGQTVTVTDVPDAPVDAHLTPPETVSVTSAPAPVPESTWYEAGGPNPDYVPPAPEPEQQGQPHGLLHLPHLPQPGVMLDDLVKLRDLLDKIISVFKGVL